MLQIDGVQFFVEMLACSKKHSTKVFLGYTKCFQCININRGACYKVPHLNNYLYVVVYNYNSISLGLVSTFTKCTFNVCNSIVWTWRCHSSCNYNFFFIRLKGVLSMFVCNFCFIKLCLYVYHVFQWHNRRLTIRVKSKYA